MPAIRLPRTFLAPSVTPRPRPSPHPSLVCLLSFQPVRSPLPSHVCCPHPGSQGGPGLKGMKARLVSPGPAVSLGPLGVVGGRVRGSIWIPVGLQDLAEEAGASMRPPMLGFSPGNRGWVYSGVRGCGLPFSGSDACSCRRDPLVSEVRRIRGPLASQGAWDHRVRLEQQERKESR